MVDQTWTASLLAATIRSLVLFFRFARKLSHSVSCGLLPVADVEQNTTMMRLLRRLPNSIFAAASVVPLLLLFVVSTSVVVVSAQENPVCCVCGGPPPCPAISNPTLIVQLPDNPLLPVSEASCDLIKQAGEDLRLIPAEVSCKVQCVHAYQVCSIVVVVASQQE